MGYGLIKIEINNGYKLKKRTIEQLCDCLTAEISKCLASDTNVALSDVFPFKDDRLFIKKPAGVSGAIKALDVKRQKQLRQLKYVEAEEIQRFFNGTYDLSSEYSELSKLVAFEGEEYVDFVPNGGVYMFCFCQDQKRLRFVAERIENILKGVLRQLETGDICVSISSPSAKLNAALTAKTDYVILLNSIHVSKIETELAELTENAFYYVNIKASEELGRTGNCCVDTGSCLKGSSIRNGEKDMYKDLIVLGINSDLVNSRRIGG